MTETSTRNVWLASYFLSRGLTFVRATTLHGPHFRVNFFFADPNNDAPRLTRQFLEDDAMQRLISNRRAVSEILDVAHGRGLCEPADVDAALRLAPIPWNAR